MGNLQVQKILMGFLIITSFAAANLSSNLANAQSYRPLSKAEIKAQEKAEKERLKAEKRARKAREEAEEEAREQQEKLEKRARKEAEKRAKECRKDPRRCPPPPQSAYTPAPTYQPYQPAPRPSYEPSYYQPSYYQQNPADTLRTEISNSYAISEQDRARLNSFYSLRAYEPVFTRSNQLSYTAQDLKRAVPSVIEHGLHAADYWDQTAEDLFTAYTLNNAAAAEVKLAQIFLKIANDVSVGRVDPREIGKEIRFAPRVFNRFADLNIAIQGAGALEAWNRVGPQHDRYLQLQVVLRRLRDMEAMGGFKAIYPPSTTLEIGVSGPTVLALKTRAQQLGYVVDSVDDIFDEQFAEIVKDIQATNMAPATGILGPKDYDAWEAFGVTSARRIQQVELTMEKLRWLPEALGERHLFVNLAKQSLEVIDPNLANPMLRRQRIVGGRFERKTPSMQDKVTTVVLNPTWTVPLTIFSEDKLPAIRQLLADPINGLAAVAEYFTSHRFVVYNSNMTQQIDPTTVDWMNLNPKLEQYWIQQLPSYNNALGVTKFLLTNSESIYLHDTNDRALLNESSRLRSSGCMRVQYPLELAEYLLSASKWDMVKISETVAKENELKEKETQIDIAQINRLPVYIISLTAELGEDNVMRFTRDEYKQNLDLLTKLESLGYMK